MKKTIKPTMRKKAIPATKRPIVGLSRPPQLTRELSVMGWIEDHFGNVLLVKQAAGKKAWTLPGGKVHRNETILNGLKRELREEVDLIVDVASPIDIFDRSEKSNITILFRVILKPKSPAVVRKGEIEKFAFLHAPPRLSTPSLKYFWRRAQKTFEPLSIISA